MTVTQEETNMPPEGDDAVDGAEGAVAVDVTADAAPSTESAAPAEPDAADSLEPEGADGEGYDEAEEEPYVLSPF
ncbi:MAG TPA: hypothetical protein VHU17_10180, partial [Acidimicrobiales bacterium]|nr:hypothetical protein [Acidimicrobiales bacterium]